MDKNTLKKISDTSYEFSKTKDMEVSGKVFLSGDLLKSLDDSSLDQLADVASLQGVVGPVIGMSDMHLGYGFPIGGVAAFDVKKGIVSPGGVGYDINCSVRLLRTNLKREDFEGKETLILEELFKAVPTGVGCTSPLKITEQDLDDIFVEGAWWAVRNGKGVEEDCLFTEEEGKMKGARPEFVSSRARSRGINQLGTLGAGNHFLDLLTVEEIFDEKTAKIFGLKKDHVVILIHCGSRGIGHQIATDYIGLMYKEYGKSSKRRELIGAPIESDLGKKYLGAMAAAANFAFANKQVITHSVRNVLKKHFPSFESSVVYDICHNIAKFETHLVSGKEQEVLVIRKGATRSLGPGRKELPQSYQNTGQPIFIPGSMATPSYVLCGTKQAEEISFASTAHGAGRAKSRTQAKKERTFEEAHEAVLNKGVFVKSGSHKGIIEEFPESYKDVNEVVEVSHKAGIGSKVARLQPFMVVIG